MPKDVLKILTETLLYSKNKVTYAENLDRSQNNYTTKPYNTYDLSLTEKNTKFGNLISDHNTYENLLKFVLGIWLVNEPIKVNLKIILLKDLEHVESVGLLKSFPSKKTKWTLNSAVIKLCGNTIN